MGEISFSRGAELHDCIIFHKAHPLQNMQGVGLRNNLKLLLARVYTHILTIFIIFDRMSTMKSAPFLLQEYTTLAKALAAMFAPYCEVVLHDLSKPKHAIIYIGNTLSNRKIGDPTTNIGMQRINDPHFPQVLQNYQSITPDGRMLKCTSFGIKDESGKTIGALCLNFDVSHFQESQKSLSEFLRIDNTNVPAKEYFFASSLDQVEKYIFTYCKKHNVIGSSLSASRKRLLVQEMKQKGLLNLKGAIDIIAKKLQISRASIYYYIKEMEEV